MAEASMQRVQMKSPQSQYSRPVLRREVELYTMQSQRIAERSLERVSYSLFSLEVILQIIAERDDVDEVEGFITESIAASDQNLNKEIERLRTLMKENSVSENDAPEYTNPVQVTIEITSPLVMHFARLLKQLDLLMVHIDTLWYGGVLNNRQRVNANYQWQQHINKLASRIIGLENRARSRAHRIGKTDEVEQQAPRKSKEDDAQATGGVQIDEGDDEAQPSVFSMDAAQQEEPATPSAAASEKKPATKAETAKTATAQAATDKTATSEKTTA